MISLSLAQKYALRAALGASRQLLIRAGKKYSTDFIGGARLHMNTVESLIAAGLMQRVEGGHSVTLTATGLMVAKAAQLENDQAETVARAHTAKVAVWEKQHRPRVAYLKTRTATPKFWWQDDN